MKDIFFDAIFDVLKIVPFLFIAFLLIELFEHKLNKLATNMFKHKKQGVVIGSLLGAIPQCGFSLLATNLYVTRILSLGTLFAIYLSTSDEMIPVMLGEHMELSLIIKVILIKIFIGIICGILIDFFLRKKEKVDFHICEDCHHHCEESIFKSSIIHTLKISLIIFIITIGLNALISFIPENIISAFLSKNSILSPFITSLIGLIPNCGASVMITELFINNFISFGSMIAGLLAGSGTSLIVLIKSNKNLKENILIILGLYFIGVLSGIIINLVM